MDHRVLLHFSIIFIYRRGNRTEQAWPSTFTQDMAKSRFSIRLSGFRLQDSTYYRRLSLLYTGVYLMTRLLHWREKSQEGEDPSLPFSSGCCISLSDLRRMFSFHSNSCLPYMRPQTVVQVCATLEQISETVFQLGFPQKCCLVVLFLFLGYWVQIQDHKMNCVRNISVSVCVCAKLLQSCPTLWLKFLATLWTVAHQTPLSMGFSRQEYWSGLPCPLLQGSFWTQGVNPRLLCLFHCHRVLYHCPTLEAYVSLLQLKSLFNSRTHQSLWWTFKLYYAQEFPLNLLVKLF